LPVAGVNVVVVGVLVVVVVVPAVVSVNVIEVPLRNPVTNACEFVSEPAKLVNSVLSRVDSCVVVDVVVSDVVVLCAMAGVAANPANTAAQTSVSVSCRIFIDLS
jgi:hypothetical protein